MTYEQLLTLEAIVERGSFKAAAESLHKTQPSLSVAIKKLEEEFDLLLFNRDEYRPSLTEQGKVFYRWVQSSLRSFRELAVIGKELGQQSIEPSLQFIIDPLVQFETVQPIFEAKTNLPSVTEFIFRTETLGAGMRLLIEGEADFAITPKMNEDERIESLPFEKLKLIPVAAKKLIKDNKPDAGWIRTHRQIVVSKDGRKKTAQATGSKGMLGEGPKCFVTDHTMKRNLILSGFGWGRLAESEIKNELLKGTLVEIQNASLPPVLLKLHVMRSKLKPMGPVASRIWEQFMKQAEERTSARKGKQSNS